MNQSDLITDYRGVLKTSMLPFLADAIDSLSADPNYTRLLDEILQLLKTGFPEKPWPKWAAGGTLKFNRSVIREEISFRDSQQYSHGREDFDLVNEAVYKDKEVMQGYYLVGLLLSYFTWIHHYWMLQFFYGRFLGRGGAASGVLEIGVGHGLFSLLAAKRWPDAQLTVTDISEHSLAFARRLLVGAGKSKDVTYMRFDVMEGAPLPQVDRLICSEVLEHIPDPLALLKQIKGALEPQGLAFVTAAINAPQIDHIYLFTSQQEVEAMVAEAGLSVLEATPVVHPNHAEKDAPPTVLAMVLGNPAEE